MDCIPSSGETESVGALGVQLGRFMHVFCCDEKSHSHPSLPNPGFDELDRLEERISSAVSQQVHTVQRGLVSLAKGPNAEIELVRKGLKLNKNIGVPCPICRCELSNDSMVRSLPYNQSKLCRP